MKSILLLSANPKQTDSLRLQEEEREIRERLRLGGYGKTPINSVGATRPRDIQQAILDFKPQIVHFSGHGSEKNGLIFEDVNGEAKSISGEALASLFRLFSNQVECVILNACYSKVQAEAIAEHTNYVIGMSQDIGDHAAIEFSIGFYTALGAGESIDFSYQLGCNAIQLEGIPEHMTPVLYVRGKYDELEIPKIEHRSDISNMTGASKIYASYPKGDDRNEEVIHSKIKKLKQLSETAELELISQKLEQAFNEMETWSHEAKFLFQEVIELCESQSSSSFLSDAYRNLALINVYEGVFSTADKYFNLSEKISRQHGDPLEIARTLFTRAVGQRFQGKYILSKRSFDDTLLLLRKPDLNGDSQFLELLSKMDLAFMEITDSPSLGRIDVDRIAQKIEDLEYPQAMMSVRYKQAIYRLANGNILEAKKILESAKECVDTSFQPNWTGNFLLLEGILSLVENGADAESLLYSAYQNYSCINFIQPIWVTASILKFFYITKDRKEAYEIESRYNATREANFSESNFIFQKLGDPVNDNIGIHQSLAKMLIQI